MNYKIACRLTMVLYFALILSLRSGETSYPYELKFDNYNWQIYCLPFHNSYTTTLGFCNVIDQNTDKTLMKIDKYLQPPFFYNEKNKSLIDIMSVIWETSNEMAELIVIYDTDGRKRATYHLRDIQLHLNKDKPEWFEYIFKSQDSLFFKLNTGVNLKLSLKDYRISFQKDFTINTEKMLNINDYVSQIYDSVTYPTFNGIPDIEDGSKFDEAISESLKLNIAMPSEALLHITAALLINENGIAEIAYLQAEKRTSVHSDFRHDRSLYDRVLSSIRDQKYDASHIPDGFPKWLFQTSVYLIEKE